MLYVSYLAVSTLSRNVKASLGVNIFYYVYIPIAYALIWNFLNLGADLHGKENMSLIISSIYVVVVFFCLYRVVYLLKLDTK